MASETRLKLIPAPSTILDEEELMSIKKESDHQIQVFKWIDENADKYPELRDFFSVPNGGYRPPKTAKRMKAEGQKSGVPDTVLPIASGGFHTLYIELKMYGRKPSPEQLDWHSRLRKNGMRVAVVYCWPEFLLVALSYLNYPLPHDLVKAHLFYRSRRYGSWHRQCERRAA
jgi:hypothetical protein